MDERYEKWLRGTAFGLLGFTGAYVGGRLMVEWLADRMVRIITQDPYRENWLEAFSSFRRTGFQTVMETDLRAVEKSLLRRPLGSPNQFPGLDQLVFHFAQLDPLPTPFRAPVDFQTTLGPRARFPLTIHIPILAAGMGYAVGLSKNARIAIARGAKAAGTASNSGEGPLLAEERAEADKLIVQYHRGNWMDLASLEHADMIEIHIGQGADGAGGGVFPPERTTPALKRELGLHDDDDVFTESYFTEMESPKGLRVLVDRARHIGGGVPVFVKLAASHFIEKDLDLCVDAGVDGIIIDGAQAGTAGTPPITQDDFGLPTLYGLIRARRHLDRLDPHRTISLIVGGGLFTPGDFLKCIALGADAVYVGTVILFAMMTGQQASTTPGEPPTEAIMFAGKQKRDFNLQQGADNVARYLHACQEEMAFAIRAMGKRSVHDLTPDDLSALNEETANITGVAPAWLPANRSNEKD